MNAKAVVFLLLFLATGVFGGYLLATSLWFHVFPSTVAILVLVILVLLTKISLDYRD